MSNAASTFPALSAAGWILTGLPILICRDQVSE